MSKKVAKAELVALLKEAGDVFKVCSRKTKILGALAWKPEVAQEFFRKQEGESPKPEYSVDTKAMNDCLEALKTLEPKLAGDHPVRKWLRNMHESFANGARLLLNLETQEFFDISTQLYGNSKSRLFNGQTTNLELAQVISSRLSVCNLNDIGESVILRNADEFSKSLEKRLSERQPHMQVKVELSDQIVAKVVAGMSRVRIRKDARFSEIELAALWNHEVESHCLTAHNGTAHETCDFLQNGGPRATMTQEGLAVFYEVYGHTMSQNRFITLSQRIEAIAMVEAGADFMQLYRWYKERLETPLEAFYQSQRIFRGARLGGGAPFTKDTVYLAGLLSVYNFLRLAVKNQNRLLVESLVCGRMALEDVGTIAWLRTHGILSPPKYVPDWLKNWEALVSFFSLSAVIGVVDLSNLQTYFDEYHHLESWDLSL